MAIEFIATFVYARSPRPGRQRQRGAERRTRERIDRLLRGRTNYVS
jgi:hypothetical protein